MNLNEKQIEAINHRNGPCLVLAGAGSGKTKVLTERIVKLIEDGISPTNILAITFTNKAASEMRNRVEQSIGDKSDFVFIGTFHSFGLKIIRENYKELGFKSNITVLDTEDVNIIIKKILKEMNRDIKKYDYRYIRNKISFAKNEMLDAESYSKFSFSEIDKLVIDVYKSYEKLLKQNNSVDFDDLLMLPLKLFKSNDDILNYYQEHYKYILVDEYQDTNTVQYELCKTLANKYKNLFVVGDNDQSIYSFRYANFKNVLNFENDYKNTKIIKLEQNYRSTKTILNAANSVIKNNKERKEKNLWSNNQKGEKIKYLRCYDEKHEVDTVIQKIKKSTTSYSDIAVFYRTNAQSRVIEEGFLKENIPYKIVGSYYFYNRKEIKDLIAYLKLIYNPEDGLSLARAINTPKRGIGAKSMQKLVDISNAKNISIFEAITEGPEFEFKKMIINLIEKTESLTLTELIEEILIDSGIRKSLEKEKTLENDIRLENLEEFKSITQSFEERNGEVSLEEFLESIALVSDVKEYKETDDAVNLMTLHSAKGLEFDVVFILGMEENLFPHINSIDKKEDLEEERRLCYVGITRAKKRLYILNAKRRRLYGKEMVNLPSRFIDEIDEELIESNRLVQKKINKNKMYIDEKNNDLKPGDKVIHKQYGAGVVISVEQSLATIAFSHKIGVKTIIKNHKSLQKI